MNTWKEQEHPRDNDGKFKDKNSIGDTAQKETKETSVLMNPRKENIGGSDYSLDERMRVVGPLTFKHAITDAKQTIELKDRWRVDIHDDYSNIKKLVVGEGGSTVAVEDSGNIVSVCSSKGGVRGHELLKQAVALGGDRLDAFGKNLFRFYTRNGFEPVSWTPFNAEYAPDEWKEAKKQGFEVGEEPVIFYKYTGKPSTVTYEEFLKTTKPFEGDDGYSNAEKKRDEEIENGKPKNDL